MSLTERPVYLVKLPIDWERKTKNNVIIILNSKLSDEDSTTMSSCFHISFTGFSHSLFYLCVFINIFKMFYDWNAFVIFYNFEEKTPFCQKRVNQSLP